MASRTEFILEVQEKGSDKIEDVKDKVEDLTKAQKMNADVSNRMSNNMDKVEKKTRLASRAVDKLKTGYEKLGSVQGIVMTLAGAAIVAYAAKIADAASALNGFSDDLGIDVQKLQVYADVATLAGSSLDGVAGAIKGINEATRDAQGGNEKIAQVFKDLNINVEKFAKLKPEEKIDKLSKAMQGFSKADQDYITKTLKAEGLSKVLKAPDEVAARASYLEKNGLIVKKEEVESLNEFTDLWSNLMTDITNFSTIAFGDFAKNMKDLFNLEPSEENSLLNRKSAEDLSEFATRLVAVFKTMYEVLIFAANGMGALVDKGVYGAQIFGVELDLLDARAIRFSKNVKAAFENYSFKEFADRSITQIDTMVTEIEAKMGLVKVLVGTAMGNKNLQENGANQAIRAGERLTEQEERLTNQYGEELNKRQTIYDKNQEEYLKKQKEFEEKRAVINRVEDKKNAENNKKIQESLERMQNSYNSILYFKKQSTTESKKEEESSTKTLTNTDAIKKNLAEINALRNLQIQELEMEGKNIEANELKRKIAIENLDETFKDASKKAEAAQIVNKLFDNNALKIKLDDVTKELDNLKNVQSGLTPFNDNWNDIADQIKQKTKDQIELQKQLKIAIKETDDQNLLSLQNLESGNRNIVQSASSSLKDYVTGAKTATEAVSSFFESLADKLLDAIINQMILNAVTGLFGGGTGAAASGSSGFLTSLGSMFNKSKSTTTGGASGTASTRHNGLAGGEITQGSLIKPDGYNFSHDEGFIVAKAGESVGTRQQLEELAGSSNQTINNNIMIDGDSLTDKLFKSQAMDRNLDNYFKKNGPLIKNYFK